MLSTRINKIIVKIYEYENYRSFLREYFSEQKKLKKMFSHRYFAKMAGFASSSFCSHVMDGKKNLSSESIEKMVAGLGLEGKAARYFELLVHFNQAKTLHDRELYFSQLCKLRKTTRFYKTNKDQFVLYDEWYFSIIRELACYCDWNDDYDALGGMVIPPVSRDKAQKAVETLRGARLLEKDDNGRYHQSAPVLSAEEAPPVMVNKLKKEFLFKGLEAEERFAKPERYSSGSTVAMSASGFDKAKRMIDDLRREILLLAMEDTTVDRVFQMNFQIFPMTRQIRQGRDAE